MEVAHFIAELKRRRVIRALAAYGVAAFAVLQIVEPVQHGLHLPDWVLTVVVAGLGLGLPVSVALAWIYDLTAEGVRRTSASPARSHHGLLFGLLAASALAGGGMVALALGRGEPPPTDEHGRLVVAVADFDNETADRELDGLSGMLITSLEQSRRLAVLTRSRMLDLSRQAGHPGVERIDEALGREIAQQAGARVLVTASVHRFDDLYAIEMKALAPGRSAYLFTLADRGQGKANVPVMIDRLSEQIRLRLRETVGEVHSSQVRVGDALTANLEAYEHYFRGVQFQETSRYDPAIDEYRKAIALDSAFALPHYRIAYAGYFGNVDAAVVRAEMDAAMRTVDRLPEKEALLIRAWNEHRFGRDQEAQALYARAVAGFPDDKQVPFMAGEHLIHWGRMAESLRYFEQATALDPTWEWARWHVVDAMLFDGRREEALSRTAKWAEQKPDGDTLKWLSRAQLASGRFAEAEASARKAVQFAEHGGPWNLAPYWARFALVDALVYQEKYEEAEDELRPMIAESLPQTERARALAILAEVQSYEGRRGEALRSIEMLPGADASAMRRIGLQMTHLAMAGSSVRAQAAKAAQFGIPGEQLAVLLALAGDLEGARERLRDARMDSPERLLHDAVAAWRRHDLDGARSRFSALTARREADYANVARLGLAEIALASERPADAIPLLEEYGPSPVIAIRWGAPPPEIFRSFCADYFRSWGYPRSLYLLALAHQRSGDPARARAAVEHLLGLWRRADPDEPLLVQAVALRRRLTPPAQR
jgi:eukaryotic-like serine/threonine-protein kinase